MNNCILCHNNKLKILYKYNKGIIVSSDMKVMHQGFILAQCEKCNHIQKIISHEDIILLNQIYATYSAYRLNNGAEEYNADGNRSKKIVNNIKDFINNGNYNILDIGTGTGVFLKEFNKQYSKWNLYAQDIKNNTSNLMTIQQFKFFFTFKKDKLYYNYFDLISAIHTFEHIEDIKSFLLQIKLSLKKDGILLLQVPNIKQNILDIFILDHISHFSKYSLYYVLKKYFKYIYFPKNQIEKEITVLATNQDLKYQDHVYSKVFLKNHIQNILLKLDKYQNNKDIAIFGTTPIALFCAAYLNFNILYFIDENDIKYSKKLECIDIVSPKNIKTNIIILFPYNFKLYNKLQKKYKTLNFIYLNIEIE